MTSDVGSKFTGPYASKIDWRVIAFWAAAAAIVIQAAASAATFADGRVWDWGHFFYAAEALGHGANPFEAGERGYIYPVTFAWALQPLAALGFEPSAVIFVCAMGISIAVALWLIRNALVQAGTPPEAAALAAAIGALLVGDKFVSTLKNAQTDGLILLTCIAALMLIRRRPIVAGLLIAVAAALKYHALIFVILFLIRRRWRAAAAALIG
ncbi:MAG: glycosyltransferase family 87 protein, partial [Oceanicaulis sp.]